MKRQKEQNAVEELIDTVSEVAAVRARLKLEIMESTFEVCVKIIQDNNKAVGNSSASWFKKLFGIKS